MGINKIKKEGTKIMIRGKKTNNYDIKEEDQEKYHSEILNFKEKPIFLENPILTRNYNRKYYNGKKYVNSTDFHLNEVSKDKLKWKRLKNKNRRDDKKAYFIDNLKVLNTTCKILGYPSKIRINAEYWYRKGIDKFREIFNNRVFTFYCIIMASRQSNYKINMDELIKFYQSRGYRVNWKLFLRARREYDSFFEKTFKLKIESIRLSCTDILYVHLAVLESKQDIFKEKLLKDPHYENILDFLIVLRKVVKDILRKLKKYISAWGNKPELLSAAIIYFALKIMQLRKGNFPLSAQYVLTQNDLAKMFGINKKSIGRVYNTKFKPFLINNLIKRTIMDLGKRYHRLKLSELERICRLRFKKVKTEIKGLLISNIKKMIQSRKIYAKYFESRKMIVFK